MPGRDSDGAAGSGTEEETSGFIEPIEIQEEMERSFLEYSMSVIVSRALPDVRDGLKPVHRRILYSMYDQRLLPDRPRNKCAKVVGDVMGSYHPHGDSAIYEALARMVQEFSMRHPLIDGHGNFGGTGPDEGPAAMRYTECRLGSLALELMHGIDQETVDFVANYDATSEEPSVLPARFPNMLVNGSQGIAVGMATNIPPHNLGEAIDATTYLLEHPDATPDDLMEFVKGPDFPTGALILGRQGILDALRTGRGSIKMRAVAEVEEGRAGETRIVVTEMPYQASIASVAKKIEDLVRAGDLDGIAEAQDDSSGGKTRLVIRLKRDANANVVLNNLFKQTPMQTTFSVNAVALVDGVPRTLNLAQMLTHYVAHQIEVVTRRSQFLLEKGTGTGPRRRRSAQGHRHARRGDRRHPGVGRPAGRARGSAGRALRVLRGAGQPHPRHDPGPAHPVGPHKLGRGVGQAAGGDRRTGVDPQRSGQAARGDRHRAGGDQGQVRQRAAHGDHPRSRGHECRGPGGRRGNGRHHEQGRVHQSGLGRCLPDPGPGR